MTEPEARGPSRSRESQPSTRRPTAVARPRSRLAEGLVGAAVIGAKALTIGFAVDAFVNADEPRLRGKGIRLRAIGYTAGLFVVPLVWRLLPDRGRYPRTLDLAVTVPLLLDAGGNALDLYEEAHVDDLVHVANAAIVSGVAGALFAPQTEKVWHAALAGAGVAITAASAWEIAEYAAWRLGANGMGLTYQDTMADLIEGFVGAAIGTLFTLTREPRARVDRRRHGWRGPLGLRPVRTVPVDPLPAGARAPVATGS